MNVAPDNIFALTQALDQGNPKTVEKVLKRISTGS